MTNEKNTFLASFRGELRDNIVEFGKRLWEKDSDVFVFMARKAACFFDCLRELKIADVRGLAISDRVLDMDLSFLKNKKVTLVDDCVFSGSTLFHARNLIMNADCQSCDTMTLAINTNWMRVELLPGGAEADHINFVLPLNKLDDSQCVQQCFDVVRAISVFPRPYDVDFPHTLTCKLSDSDFDKLLNVYGWTVYDVSSEYQIKHSTRVFTLVPSPELVADFSSSHGGSDNILQGVKLRVYAKRISNDGWSVRLVSIAMLSAVNKFELMNPTILGDAFESIALALGALSAHSRYRLLGFLISWAFLKTFNVNNNCIPVARELRLDLANMIFGERFSIHATQIYDQLDVMRFPNASEELEPEPLTSYEHKVVSTDNPVELASACVSPFILMYNK